ncbi:hypothetical protein MTO96_026429 [Rhipicephalus appendiculatus]
MGKSLVDNWLLMWRASLSDTGARDLSRAIENLELYVFINSSVPHGPDMSLLPNAFNFPYFDEGATGAFNYAGVGSRVAQGLGELFLKAHFKSKLDPIIKTYLDCMQNSSLDSLGRSSWARYMEPVSLKTALDAYRAREGASGDRRVVGLEFLTPEQLFFVAACFTRCAGGSARYGGVAPAQCDATFRHVEEFADVFGCPPESPMNPAERCTLL